MGPLADDAIKYNPFPALEVLLGSIGYLLGALSLLSFGGSV